MATTPLGGRLPNVNRKGSSPCVGGSSSSSGSATSQRKQQQQERTGRDHHHHHHHHRHHQSKSGQSHHHHHHHAQQTHRKDQKQPERTHIQQQSNHQSSTVAAHAGELDPAATNATNNFEYDDNEWDIGIGDLIIDLDADIEKTRDEKLSAGTGMASTPASAAATTNHLNSASSSNSPSSSNGQFSSSSGSSNSGTCSQGNGSNSNSGANSSIASVGGASSKQQVASVNSAAHPNQGNPGKMAVEHSATVDKGLKMKIKRTKPGTKSSEAKHEIVKSNELNGTVSAQDAANCSSNSSSNSASMSASSPGQAQMQNATQDSQTQSGQSKSKPTHQQTANTNTSGASVSTNTGSKRGSSGHRRDEARDKHDKQPQSNHQSQQSKPEINGSIRPIMQNHAGSATSQNPGSGQSIGSPPTTTSTSSASSSCSSSTSSAPSGAYSNSASPGGSSSSAIAAIAGSNAGQQQGPTPAATAPQQQQPPGPPPSSRTGGFSVSQGNSSNGAAVPCPPASPASATAAAGSASKPEQTKVASVPGTPTIGSMPDDSIDMDASPPPSKKMKISPKNEPKDMSDMCVGTSVGTITEPECLGPCEPGTSVTLEGIVWHETEGGVLVVNVTWRGKTYVGTLLDCTRHDWAPPRFCDSPTSDLDARTPRGRGKRGRAAANATPGNDLSNFTETRSSVHSKLRNGGAKGRRGARGSPAASPSPAAFVPPRPDPAAKRKPRGPEEEEKSKRRAPPPTPPSGSPPASPVLLECPEPNCSKKYKHINGLKYHQSHAHGSADDEDTKEGITSMSENDESNIEAPSPATPVKSPPDVKTEVCTPVRVASPPSTLPPETPPRVPSPGVEVPADKSIVKPGVLRFGQDAEQRSVQPSTPTATPIVTPSPPSPGPRQSPRPAPSPHIPQPITIPQPPQPSQNLIMQQQQQQQPPPQITVQSAAPQSQPAVPVVHQMQPLPAHSQQAQVHLQNQPLPPTPPTSQPIQTLSPLQSLANQMPPTPGLTGSSSSHLQSYPGVGLHTKIPQFKVKPTAALMPEQDKSKDPRATKPQGYEKKSRKSPGGSPHPPMETPMVDNTREDVQSPAYSDISDDGAPVLEAESADKSLKQGQDKDPKAPPPSHIPAHFGIYPYYGQPPPYLVPSVQQTEKQPGDSSKPSDLATKPDPGKTLNVPQMPSMTSLQSLATAAGEKDKRELSSPQAQAQAQPPQPHYYGSYGAYMPSSYPYPPAQPAQAHQNQQDDAHDPKKIKQEPQHTIKDKQHENHGIIKDGMELKMSPYGMFHRSAPSERSVPPANAPLPPDDRRYYLYPGEQRRKEESKSSQQVKPPAPSPKHQSKSGQPVQDKPQDLKSEDKIKQEGVKPTMETQGPPPPPTSQYAYIHPGYMPPQHYGALSFDPGHPMYRGISPMLVPGPYTGGPYLHQIPRYHGPEDLSRPPGKALELLQHHASQYYTAHKIHELQERALKSPTPKSSATSASPSAPSANPSRPPSGPPSSAPGPGPPQLPPGQTQSGKQPPTGSQSQAPQSQQAQPGGNASEKESRSPPPQRHVHTHHHTHVGLGYPLLPSQYPASYGEI